MGEYESDLSFVVETTHRKDATEYSKEGHTQRKGEKGWGKIESCQSQLSKGGDNKALLLSEGDESSLCTLTIVS